MREYMRLVSMLVSIPVALYSGWPFYQGAWHALRARSVSMDVPVSVGIVLASSRASGTRSPARARSTSTR